jgi:hypothetical protein
VIERQVPVIRVMSRHSRSSVTDVTRIADVP